MPIIEIAKIQVRRGTELGANNGVPQLAPGEFAWAVDTQNLYIGKRQYEDGVFTGASDDSNTRILTEKDLNSILTMASQNLTITNLNTSSYRFKGNLGADNLTYGIATNNGKAQTLATTSSYGVYTKLDNFVSITDFAPGGIWPPLNNDITIALQNAIGITGGPLQTGGGVVFQTTGTDGPTALGPYSIKIPPGQWALSSPVFLPPYTSLVGEGSAMTVLTATNMIGYNGALFQTVDSTGTTFSQGMNLSPASVPRSIKLKGMTIQPPNQNPYGGTLLSLDNAQDVTIDDVYFGNPLSTTSTSSITAIQIRSSQPVITDVTISVLKNIKINNCTFQGLTTGIISTGTIDKFSITGNKFSWLNNGVVTSAPSGNAWGINGNVENNMFEYISAEAMIIGTSTNAVQSYVSSAFNSFVNVGNNFQSDTTQTNNIITVNDKGFQSHHDYFDRLVNSSGINPLTATPSGKYQYPLISANSIMRSGTTFKKTIPGNTGIVSVLRIPMTANSQVATMNYNAYNANMSRQGQLVMSISTAGSTTIPDGFASVTDKYQFEENTAGTSPYLKFTTNLFYSQQGIIAQGGFFYPWGTLNSSGLVAGNTSTQFNWQNGTSTYIIPGTTKITFESPTAPFNGSYTATVNTFTVTNGIATIQLDTTATTSVGGLTTVIFSNGTASWSSTTVNSYVFSTAQDPSIEILSTQTVTYTTSSLLQPYIYKNGDLTKKYLVTTSSYISTLSSYVLYFTTTGTVSFDIQDIVDVQIANSNFSNYVELTAINVDTVPTSVEVDLTLMN